MTKPFDLAMRAVLSVDPLGWTRWLGYPGNDVRLLDTSVSAASALPDHALRIENPEPWVLHLESQSTYDPSLPERMLWYNVALRRREELPVRSVVLLLRRSADGPAMRAAYESAFPNESATLRFRFRAVRVWRQSPEVLLNAGIGLTTLAPLAATSKKELAKLIPMVRERFDAQPTNLQAELWSATYLLLGLRYDQAFVDQLLRGVAKMRESATYQGILAEGAAKGFKEGEAIGYKEGKAIGAQVGAKTGEIHSLLLMGEKRFGPPDAETKAAIEAIDDLQVLDRLICRAFDVHSWEELLAGASSS